MPRLFDGLDQIRSSENKEIQEILAKAELEKSGARFSNADMKKLQSCHDNIAGMCDKVHCAGGYGDKYGNTPESVDSAGGQAGMLGPDIKIGARHNQYDMLHMKAAHDSLVALGCKCE